MAYSQNIYVSGGLEGKTYVPPSTPVEINQIDCHYVPHGPGYRSTRL